MSHITFRHSAFAVLGLIAPAITNASTVVFTVDPARSSLTLTPSTTNLNTGDVLSVSRQSNPANPSADSFVTSYSGSIIADIAESTIQFLSPSQIIANETNSWRPGTDYSQYPADINSPTGYVNTYLPAAYGVVTDLSPLGDVLGQGGYSASATRNLRLSLTDASPRTLTNGSFDEVGIDTAFVWDTSLSQAPALVYYSSGGAPPVTRINTIGNGLTDTLATTESGSLIIEGDVQTLSIPIKFRIAYFVNFLLVDNTYEGVIVATAPVPEPGSLACLSAAALLLRRKRS